MTPRELRDNFNRVNPDFLPNYEKRVRLIRDAPTVINMTTAGDELQLQFGGPVVQTFYANLTPCERQEFHDTMTQVATARGDKPGTSIAEGTILNMAGGRGILNSVGRGIQAGTPQLVGTFARGFWEPLGPVAYGFTQIATNQVAKINLAPVVIMGHSTMSLALGISHLALFMTNSPVSLLMWLTTTANLASLFMVNFGADEYLFGKSITSFFNMTLGVDVETETGTVPFYASKSRRNEK